MTGIGGDTDPGIPLIALSGAGESSDTTQVQCKRCLAVWDHYMGIIHRCEAWTETEIRRAFAEHGSPDSWGVQVIYEDILINYLREQREVSS